MLTSTKKAKLATAFKNYRKKFLNNSKLNDLDESGTRIMINDLLTEVLGYIALEEVKTEYMIKGTYADYVVQMKGVQYFLVEVKAISISLSEKHLRQAVNYGANEGIEWAILTNGRQLDLYKIVFGKPISHKLVFSLDFSDPEKLKSIIEDLQFLHKEAVLKKSLSSLWNKHSALDPATLAGLMYNPSMISLIKRELKKKYKSKFEDTEIQMAIGRLISQAVNPEHVKIFRSSKSGKKKETTQIQSTPPEQEQTA